MLPINLLLAPQNYKSKTRTLSFFEVPRQTATPALGKGLENVPHSLISAIAPHGPQRALTTAAAGLRP